MNETNPPEPQAWRALLLHRLPDGEAQALEQRLLAEPGLLDALRDAEYDLFDDYVQDRLDRDERHAFARYLLTTPEAAERLRVSRALLPVPEARIMSTRRARFGQPAARPRRRSAWIALAGGAIAAGLALAVVLLPRLSTNGTAQTATVAGDPQATQILVLLASVERGALQSSAVGMTLAETTVQVRIQAEIDQPVDEARYRLSVFVDAAADASPLFRAEHLALASAGHHRYIEARLPAKLLADGAKVIRVEAEAPAVPFAFDWTVSAAASR